MDGGCYPFGVVDPVHNVQVAIVVQITRLDEARFPLALAFGNNNKVASLPVVSCGNCVCDSLSLRVYGVESEPVALGLMSTLMLSITLDGLRTEEVGLGNIRFQHILQPQFQRPRTREHELPLG